MRLLIFLIPFVTACAQDTSSPSLRMSADNLVPTTTSPEGSTTPSTSTTSTTTTTMVSGPAFPLSEIYGTLQANIHGLQTFTFDGTTITFDGHIHSGPTINDTVPCKFSAVLGSLNTSSTYSNGPLQGYTMYQYQATFTIVQGNYGSYSGCARSTNTVFYMYLKNGQPVRLEYGYLTTETTNEFIKQ